MSEKPWPDALVVTDQDKIKGCQMLARRAALRLELKGMKRRGRSMFSIIKEEHGLKGNRQSIFDQYDALVKEYTGV